MRPAEVLLFYALIGLAVGWMAWRTGRAPVWAAAPFWPLGVRVLHLLDLGNGKVLGVPLAEQRLDVRIDPALVHFE